MKKLLILAFTVASLSVFAQYHPASHNQIHFQNRAMGFMTSLSAPPKGIDGSYYLDQEWHRADIFFKDSTKIGDISVRIDLKDNLVEILHNQTIKVLPNSKVWALSIHKSNGEEQSFINGSYLNNPGTYHYDRLLQIISEGPVMLLSKTIAEIIPASGGGNPMLDVGNKDDKIVLKKKYIIGKGPNFVDAGTTKSNFKDQMIKMFGSDIEPLVKKTNPKKEQDLLGLVKELNERTKS
jgi:hypothetical protein